MVHVHATPVDDEFIASDFRAALSKSLLHHLNAHLLAIAIGSFPSILFVIRIWRSPSTVITSRLIRALLSVSALLYFPLLVLWTSIVLTILTFLLHQTAAVERLLHVLCNAVTSPVIERLLTMPSTTLSLSDLRRDLRHSGIAVRKREALVAKIGRRSLLRALVRILTNVGIRAAIAALAYVAETRFKDAIPSSPAADTDEDNGVPSQPPTSTNLSGDVHCKKTSARLSRTVIIAILRTEMVSAVLLPFKASLKMYLYGTLIVAVILIFGPIWLLW